MTADTLEALRALARDDYYGRCWQIEASGKQACSICADPGNCREPIEGYVCRKGHISATPPPERPQEQK